MQATRRRLAQMLAPPGRGGTLRAMTDSETSPTPAFTPAPTPAAACRRLLRSAEKATLSTAMADGSGPYGSLVLTACTPAGEPLLLLSDLADHTRNFMADDRVSLMIDGTAGLDDPLTGARASLLGRIEKVEDDLLRTRYVRRHPSARFYAGFRDFNLYRIVPERAHLVAGFGRIHWVEAADGLLYDGTVETLAGAEAEILAHMNADHLDAVGLYANRLLGRGGVGWFLTGVDPEGCDLRRQGEVARLDFERPAEDSDAVRRELVGCVKRARQMG